MLGLARRAGAVEVGVARARGAVATGRARLLVVASDGAPGQRAKVEPAARRAEVPIVELCSAEELGEALGMQAVTAVAVTDGSLARAVRESAVESGRTSVHGDGAANASI